MIRWSYLPIVGTLALLAACADTSIDPSPLNEAELAKRRALTACQLAADAANRPLVRGDVQLYSRPGQPRYPSPDWQRQQTRSVAECMAAKGYTDFVANAS
jgi:hypothetical protein